MQEIEDRLQGLERAVAKLSAGVYSVLDLTEKKRSASVKQRQLYLQAKELRDKGKVLLPTKHVLTCRDRRIKKRVESWARVGMKFGARDKPEEFIAYICYEWNNKCYLKKPLTYSGGYFRVHVGNVRHNYSRSDLMGLNLKQRILLRHAGDAQDFSNRPWWDWAFNVLFPVYQAMEELPGFSELPPRFLKCVRLLLGGFGGHEVYTELYWDQNETMLNINKMLKRVGLDLRLMWKACCSGLLMKSSPAEP